MSVTTSQLMEEVPFTVVLVVSVGSLKRLAVKSRCKLVVFVLTETATIAVLFENAKHTVNHQKQVHTAQ